MQGRDAACFFVLVISPRRILSVSSMIDSIFVRQILCLSHSSLGNIIMCVHAALESSKFNFGTILCFIRNLSSCWTSKKQKIIQNNS